jgi:hypothetical protein
MVFLHQRERNKNSAGNRNPDGEISIPLPPQEPFSL